LNRAQAKLFGGWKKTRIGAMMSLIDDVANNANDAAKAVGARLSKPIIQNTKEAGLAVVYPVGVPAVAMVAGAGVVNAASKSPVTDRAAAAKKLLVNTALASQKGNLAARRALQTLAIVAKSRPGGVGRRPPTLGKGRAAISPARVAWLKRQKGSVRAAWLAKHKHLPRVVAYYNKLFRRPPTLKPRKPSKSPEIEAAEKRGEMRAGLRAIAQMRERGRTGIMMGTRKIDHGKFIEVP
jgi:hypothetical protein